MESSYSFAPDGKKFLLPTEKENKEELIRIENLVKINREKGREIVVVIGIGFVGAVMAAVVANAVDKNGNPCKFVIGMQRPSVRSFWKIPFLNRGISPVKSEDPEVDKLIYEGVCKNANLTATHIYDVLQFADVVIIDVQCDYSKKSFGNTRNGWVEMSALEDSFEIIGSYIHENTLVLIETTVAPGTTQQVAYPIIKKIFKKRGMKSDPLLAHSYERVMPGKNYVASIRDFWRVCSGINEQARKRVVEFLNQVINTKKFPLTVLDTPIESETAKIIENSFRASCLAFLDEWSLFSERNGVDLLKVIDAIKKRPTHNNMIFPGPGIGGYCLPKDGALGYWAYKHILGWEDDIFKITTTAIDINDKRSLHVAQLTRDALRNMGQAIATAAIALLGASYREDVGDTRYSGSEIVVRRLAEMGAEIRVHDPYVDHWWEFEKQEVYPPQGRSVFFRNQKKLKDLKVEKDLNNILKGTNAIIFAVRHKPYLELAPDQVVKIAGQPIAVIDCFGILDDKKIKRYFELGCEVKGLGRGHINRIKKVSKKR